MGTAHTSSRKDLPRGTAAPAGQLRRKRVQAVPPAAPVTTLGTPDGKITYRVEPIPAPERARLAAGSPGIVNGICSSPKNGRPMAYPNRWIGRLMVLLEVNREVVAYETFPERVFLALNGEPRSYAPAIRARHRGGGTAVIDVVDGEVPPEGTPGSRALTAIYAERGWRYQRLSRAQVSVEPRLGNAAEILAHAYYTAPTATERAVVGALTGRGWKAIGDLEATLPAETFVRGTVLALALRGDLRADLAAADLAAMRVRLESWRPRG